MTLNGPEKKSYAARRSAVLDQLDGSVLFIAGPPEAIYANDVHYRYRPDTNIRYLTGFEEPSSLLLSRSADDEAGTTFFVRPCDPAAETWTGRRAGIDGARETYGADHAYGLDEALTVLERHLRKADKLYFAHCIDRSVNERVMDIVHRVNMERPRTGASHIVVADVRAVLDEMRLHKSNDELTLLRRACEVSCAAHRRTMESVVPGMNEFDIEAMLEHDFRRGGCRAPAYGTIAAGGDNATVLHYTANDQKLRDGDLVLIDAGGEYGGYCADITRTWPVGQRFSDKQAALYDLVLDAQLAAIDAVKPGATIDGIHEIAVGILAQGLIDLGLLVGPLDACLESESYRDFYMHRTSHWLGMDVHDAGAYRVAGEPRRLEPGMVLTVEPGLYVGPGIHAKRDTKGYEGIGIRIEDDIAVTSTGSEVLTAGAPKSREDIEALRAGANR
jgi:Xaa-Pro aminopeptidase